MQTVRAAVCRGFGAPLTIEKVRLAPPKLGEVEVTLDAVAICHSDISFAEGAWGGSLPAVYGHEAAGRVTQVGPGVLHLAPGDSVVVTLIRACGGCGACANGHPTLCEAEHDDDGAPLQTGDGGPLHQGMATGAFAEKVVVDHSQVVAIPADMPKAVASVIGCSVITGIGAVVNTARLKAGEDVVVIGAGGVGLNAIQGARLAGARRIVAVDQSEDKLAIARAFGATDGVLASDPQPHRAAIGALGRAADAVFVTVGAISAYAQAPQYLARGGRMVLVGMPPSGATAPYEPVILSYLGQSLLGSKMGDVVLRRDVPWMIDLYRQGRLKLDELISRRWRLEDINAAIADTKTGSAKRNVIVFDR